MPGSGIYLWDPFAQSTTASCKKQDHTITSCLLLGSEWIDRILPESLKDQLTEVFLHRRLKFPYILSICPES